MPPYAPMAPVIGADANHGEGSRPKLHLSLRNARTDCGPPPDCLRRGAGLGGRGKASEQWRGPCRVEVKRRPRRHAVWRRSGEGWYRARDKSRFRTARLRHRRSQCRRIGRVVAWPSPARLPDGACFVTRVRPHRDGDRRRIEGGTDQAAERLCLAWRGRDQHDHEQCPAPQHERPLPGAIEREKAVTVHRAPCYTIRPVMRVGGGRSLQSIKPAGSRSLPYAVLSSHIAVAAGGAHIARQAGRRDASALTGSDL